MKWRTWKGNKYRNYKFTWCSIQVKTTKLGDIFLLKRINMIMKKL